MKVTVGGSCNETAGASAAIAATRRIARLDNANDLIGGDVCDLLAFSARPLNGQPVPTIIAGQAEVNALMVL